MAGVSTTSGGLQYVGNPDFRGYLSALAAQGDGQAKTAVSGYDGYGYVDNNGKINTGLLNELNQAAPGGGSDQQYQQAATNYVNNAFAQYNQLVNGGGGGGGGATDPLATYKTSFLNSLPSAISNINQGGADAFSSANNQLQGNANSIFSGFRTGQQNIDTSRENNELSRMNATQDLLSYIRNGLHQGASQLANMNATDSSAAGALGSAYNQVGSQKQRSINNQAAVAGHGIDINQNNLNQGLQDSLTQFHLTRDNLANQIGANVRSQLAALDQQGAGLGLTGKVDIEGQKQGIINAGMGQLQAVDQWLQGQLGGVAPEGNDKVQANAYQLQQAGNASPNQFANPGIQQTSSLTGPQLDQLPLFSIKKSNGQ